MTTKHETKGAEISDAVSIIRPQAVAYRPERISIAPDPDPRCPPLRLSDCPACGADPGKRCIGIGRDDVVHIERVWQCLAQRNGGL
jgi:hypothetical protein